MAAIVGLACVLCLGCDEDTPQDGTVDIAGQDAQMDVHPESSTPCPHDWYAADGTPCDEEGWVCGGCTDPCQMCAMVRCEGGTWRWQEVFPDPACYHDVSEGAEGVADIGDVAKSGETTGTGDADDTPEWNEPCPTDFFEADGTPCVDEGRFCGAICTDPCQFCNLLRCEEGRWIWMEAFPDPACLCAEIEASYQELTTGAGAECAEDADCQILPGQCSFGLGGCWEAVNHGVNPEDLGDLGLQYQDSGCTQGVCDCAGPPAQVLCKDARCAFAEPGE